ncbi:MAG: outer membrane protein assembly factor BamD [Hyphomicrobiales bacterium]|nr:outer membrane protein assembly factor BamD [Hyphomicrobiales bacterium]MBP9174894.1 outer membrane protein assembly factor BamD [Hyphomicrobiales bacterium]MCC7480917.1 outer membrane protein assembly factor BamD [Hyphomicrobiales bacterium]HRA94649.1 outer membrane protein assembly factor BamD [Aestuariivirga sp.]
MQASRLLGIAAVALGLAGCSTASVIKDVFGNDSTPAASTSVGLTGGALSPTDEAPGRSDPVAELYNGGLEKLKSGSYKSAAKSFAEVERQHPYSKWATKALLMQAFAYYQHNKYDDAINAANRFITLHPGHKDSAYAYYLTAISQYEQISDVRRDQSRTQKALEALEEVGKRYPQSPYAADAMKKADMARDHLAAKEMEVGRYYLKKGSYLAGINRFKKVVTDYQTTSQVPEALYRLSEGYMALGVVSEAQTAAAVLGQNFPNSEWYKDAYTLVSSDGQQPVENKKSWISRLFSS